MRTYLLTNIVSVMAAASVWKFAFDDTFWSVVGGLLTLVLLVIALMSAYYEGRFSAFKEVVSEEEAALAHAIFTQQQQGDPYEPLQRHIERNP